MRLKCRILSEAIEGLPTSTDPYAPAKRSGAPAQEEPLDQPPMEEPEEQSGQEPDLGDDEIDDILEEPGGMPEMPTWEPFEVPNKKDMAFRRDDGFLLRARRLESIPNKWVAQLWKQGAEGEILDKGTIFIPDDMDPGEYLQKVSDYMLDGKSRRYTQSQMMPGLGGEGAGGGEIAEPGGVPEADSAEADEEMGLEDEDMEFDLEPEETEEIPEMR